MLSSATGMRPVARGAAAAVPARPAAAAATRAAAPRPAPAPARRRRPQQCPAAVSAEHAQLVSIAAYAGIAAAGLSFVGTFFVIPQFKDQFKEGLDWRTIYEDLVASGGVPALDATEAADAAASGAVLVDVRLGQKYEAGHAAGSLSLPLYLPIQGWGLAANLRRAGFAFFGIYGTELNTQFGAQARQRIAPGKRVILICENGGSLQNKSGTKLGFQSRSLKAAYYLRQAGFEVAYLRGGLGSWQRAQLPMDEGAEDAAAAAAAASAVPASGAPQPQPLGVAFGRLLGGLLPARR